MSKRIYLNMAAHEPVNGSKHWSSMSIDTRGYGSHGFTVPSQISGHPDVRVYCRTVAALDIDSGYYETYLDPVRRMPVNEEEIAYKVRQLNEHYRLFKQLTE